MSRRNGRRTAGRRHLRNLYRYDRPTFEGWGVLFNRGAKQYSRFFPDHSDRQRSLDAALRWRARMLATLPPPLRIKREFSRNTTGVIGIHLRKDRTPSGELRLYYGATWYDLEGRQHKRLFALAKHGKRQALTLAIRARKEALASLLAPRRCPSTLDRRQHEAARIVGRRGRRPKPFS